MTNAELADELEGLAKDATPGPWAHEYGAVGKAGEKFGPGYPPHHGSIMHGDDGEYVRNPRANDDAALIVGLVNALPAILLALRSEGRMRAEIADLKVSVIAFCGPHAATYAREFSLPKDHLHPIHYDILERCGARMDGFTRAAVTIPRQALAEPNTEEATDDRVARG